MASFDEFLNLKTPNASGVKVYSVTTSSAVLGDLSADLPGSDSGHLIEMIADQACYLFFNNANSGTVDETATSGATQAYLLPANVPRTYNLAHGYTWLVVKGAAACKLRVHISSARLAQ